MKPKELERYLKSSGFTFIRDAKSGQIWSDGKSTVMVGRDMNSARNLKNLQAEVNRAIKARPTAMISKMNNLLDEDILTGPLPGSNTPGVADRAYLRMRLKGEEKLRQETLDREIEEEKQRQRQEFLRREAQENAPRIQPVSNPTGVMKKREGQSTNWIPIQKEGESKPLSTSLGQALQAKPIPIDKTPYSKEKTLIPEQAKAPEAAKKEEKSRGYRKFDKETKALLDLMIREMYVAGKSNGEILQSALKDGFAYDSGEPVDVRYIQLQVYFLKRAGVLTEVQEREQARARERLSKKEAKLEAPDNTDPVPAAPVLPPPASLPVVEPAVHLNRDATNLVQPSPPLRSSAVQVLPAAVTGILLDSTIPDPKKIKMLSAFKKKLSESALMVLNDPDLSDDEKLAALLAYVE